MPQLSTTVRNARLDAVETAIGTSPILRIFTGSAPANTGAASSGTELVEITLPSDWAAAASSASKALAGSWTDTAGADGTAGHYRIFASDGTTCHLQGNCGVSGSGAEMILSSTSITTLQTVTVISYTMSEPEGSV